MTEHFTYLAPTRLEARHLGRGLSDGRVHVTGMGRRRALDARTKVHNPYGAVAVAGVGGGLSRRLAPGDVVVADRVWAEGTKDARVVPGARLLAGSLRRLGVPVTVGPVVSTTRPALGKGRERLAAQGAVCVDMESAWLVDGQEHPFALLRVVADDAASGVLHPRTLGKLTAALNGLDRVGPALDAWSRALGERTVLVAGPRSFCAGVVRAIDIVEAALERRGAPIYVRKEIVHNVHVVDDLRRRGAVFVEDLAEVPTGSTVVFSAHGVSPEVRADADARGLDVIDATCPLVSKVHAEVRRFARADDTVIFIGHAGHDETLGTMGERPDRTVLVQDAADAKTVAVPDPDRVSYLVQTTLAADEVAEVVDVLSARFPALQAPPSDDICYATTNRQQALQAVATEADLCLVVGSQNSSNSQRLVERSLRLGTPAYLIDDVDDIDLAWLADVEVVGVTAGASAPMRLVDEVVDALRGLGPVTVEHKDITVEDTHFTLPKEVR